MTVTATSAYPELLSLLRAAATLGSVGALLSWDQETDMPPKAAPFRAEQLATISSLTHERRTDPRIGELLAACEEDAELLGDEEAAANLREIRHDYDRAVKLPPELVREIAETSSRAMEAWKDARKRSDFKAFAPWLKKQVELQRRKAECYGAPKGGELYDALLEDYEPGFTAKQVEGVFGPLRAALAPLIAQIAARPQPDDAINRTTLPVERQKAFNRMVAERMGFDFGSGMLAVSTHPFSSGLAPGDVRMTTRYKDDHFTEAVSTTLHESGHSFYEMGLPKDERFGQPLGESVSLGIHESQSRLWENQVGRSLAFWKWAMPEAKKIFAPALDRFGPEDAHRAINIVKPGFIRVESDEATYHMHVMLRFDVERSLIRGDMKVEDVPRVWNDRMKKDLGLVVTEDRLGCLQDVHWSMGAIGYFPTYTLGTLYAAQFWEVIRRDIPDIDSRIAHGSFGTLLGWLREHVHAHGRRFRPPELCRRITGRTLSHEPMMGYLTAKLKPIYGL